MKAKEIIVPTITLVLITLVITGLLVLTNGATKDQIAKLQVEAQEEAKKEVLPDGDSFTDQTITVDGEDVTYYEADNGAGYVFLTSSKGYGGAVEVMTGISADGQVTGVKLTSQNETPGLGQKALDASFTDQYKLEIPENGFAVTKDSPSGEITAIAGATITSRAVTNSVNEAVAIFDAVTGGGN